MRHLILAILLATFFLPRPATAADWPMWRYNAMRGASSPDRLPARLHMQWSRQLPAARPAWPKTQPKLQFDIAPQPVVMGSRIFVPSTANDSLTAYDTKTGDLVWRFYAEGPIRFAPVAQGGKVYFVSDDGYLYCVSAADGRLKWRVNGGPSQRAILGHGRLISSWPARGGPVLHEGKIYFTASIWPLMGIFIHAVDAETGKTVWTNSGDGTNWTIHPHGAGSFGGVAPQGHLVVCGDTLIVPGGRSTPAVYDLKTGKLRHFRYDHKFGGHRVTGSPYAYFIGGRSFSTTFSSSAGPALTVVGPEESIIASGSNLRLVSTLGKVKHVMRRDRRGRTLATTTVNRKQLGTFKLTEGPTKIFFRAGSQLYTGTSNQLAAYDLKTADKSGTLRPTWTAVIEGRPWEMLAADGRLFVMTDAGRLFCFGGEKKEAKTHGLPPVAEYPTDKAWATKATAILSTPGTNDGFALCLGVGTGKLAETLLDRSDLHVIVIDADAKRIETYRRRMDARGLYGERTSAIMADPTTYVLPRYLANLIVSEDPAAAGFDQGDAFARAVFSPLRPYGGTVCLELTDAQHAQLAKQVAAAKLSGAVVTRDGGLTRLTRAGSLSGAGTWTHQYGSAAQSVVSQDTLVKAPLGLLWFGGASHEGILPRHGHGPSPQVAGGRLVIEGPNMLRSVDVYTGRVLWEKNLPGVGKYYDNTSHFAGAGEIGSNYVTLADRVYVVYGRELLELDAANGKTTKTLTLAKDASGESPYWGYLGVDGDLLVTTSSPVAVRGVASRRKATPPSAKQLGLTNVIPPRAEWRYLAGSDPKKDWTVAEFDDAKWKTGKAGFGYGDGDDTTRLNMQGRYRRVYVRRKFADKDVAAAKKLFLLINFDDAFIAYLNGKEVLRVGVGRGSGPTATGVRSHEAAGHQVMELSGWKKLLREGDNVLAIEGHNVSATSSDFSLDPYLAAKTASSAKPKPEIAKKPVKKTPPRIGLPSTRYASSSRRLTVLDRKTGKVLWHRDAQFSFRHNNIVVAAGKVFCLDALTDGKRKSLSRRGITLSGKSTLYALDARTGRVVWSTDERIFGTFLNYSAKHDTLVQAGSAYRDRARDESKTGIIAYRGTDGTVLWDRPTLSHGGPCLLWRDVIITNGGGGFAIDIKTGKPTGWKYGRMYGCNTAIGSQHLLTFRSGAAGFCDLAGDSGTGNFGGFKSSCTSNLVVADGVLNAPDYTRTCSCAYQNQTSLALVHMPEAEFWTFGGVNRPGRVGVNFGAPGDRRDADGTLWMAKGAAKIEPADAKKFRLHSSLVADGKLKWVAASGLKGVERVTLPAENGKSYLVTLHFLEPEAVPAARRVIDVAVQGEKVLTGFNISKQAGGPRRAVEKQFTATAADGKIIIELSATGVAPTVLSGVEIVRQ
jgi:outer membrane protein assembly factor BamB